MSRSIEWIVERLKLEPHPEGGHYRETYRSELRVEHPGVAAGLDRTRPAGTGIYFLLAAGDFSAFHRIICSDETWHFYAGDPLELHVIDAAGAHEVRILTADLARGEPVSTVPAGCWQAARSTGAWTLAGTTVAPGFTFADWEMPTAAELGKRHPSLDAIIRELTKR